MLDQVTERVSEVCQVREVERERRLNMLDNSSFIMNFARRLSDLVGLDDEAVQDVMVNANRIMQNLMSTNANPFKPFDYIDQAAQALAHYRGDSYGDAVRVTRHQTASGVAFTCIEPPCGSDTWVFECEAGYLVFDAGLRCFSGELHKVLLGLYPDFDDRTSVLALTHYDLDHVGDVSTFTEVYASGRSIDSFTFESMGIVNWREQSMLAMPYNLILKHLCAYEIPDVECMRCLGEPSPFGMQEELFRRIDTLEMEPLTFEVWEGKGGHVRGETVFIECRERLCVAGDIYVSIHGQTKPQAAYNALGPFLMSRVDTDAVLARQERTELLGMFDQGSWQILGGHGPLMAHEAR